MSNFPELVPLIAHFVPTGWELVWLFECEGYLDGSLTMPIDLTKPINYDIAAHEAVIAYARLQGWLNHSIPATARMPDGSYVTVFRDRLLYKRDVLDAIDRVVA